MLLSVYTTDRGGARKGLPQIEKAHGMWLLCLLAYTIVYDEASCTSGASFSKVGRVEQQGVTGINHS